MTMLSSGTSTPLPHSPAGKKPGPRIIPKEDMVAVVGSSKMDIEPGSAMTMHETNADSQHQATATAILLPAGIGSEKNPWNFMGIPQINVSSTTMQYIHKRLKTAATSAKQERHIAQRAGSIPLGVIFQRKPPPMRTLLPNVKLQYGSSPASAFQIDAN